MARLGLKGRGTTSVNPYGAFRRSLAAERRWSKAVAVTGALGSGKTTWTVNLGLALHRMGRRIALADLDIINPYFCLREIADDVSRLGIDVVLPPGEARWSDIPVISPEVTRLLASDRDHLFLDVGGEAKGVLALKQFSPFLEDVGYDFLMVLNPFRPQTSKPEAVVAMRHEMEKLSGLHVTGLLGNPHLMEATEPEDVARGLALICQTAEVVELPLLYVGVSDHVFERAREVLAPGAELLWPLSRPILFPWERSVPLDG